VLLRKPYLVCPLKTILTPPLQRFIDSWLRLCWWAMMLLWLYNMVIDWDNSL
jgi:hypothetical protein